LLILLHVLINSFHFIGYSFRFKVFLFKDGNTAEGGNNSSNVSCNGNLSINGQDNPNPSQNGSQELKEGKDDTYPVHVPQDPVCR
jgi:hypothetical protein